VLHKRPVHCAQFLFSLINATTSLKTQGTPC